MTLDLIFTLEQALDLIGLLQCLFIVGMIVLKAADRREAAPTLVFFAVLGLGFGLPLLVAAVDSRLAAWYVAASWLAQACIPPLSYLLILQLATGRLPAMWLFAVFALAVLGPPAALALIVGAGSPEVFPLLRVFGVAAGTVILLLLWWHRGLLTPIREQPGGRDRYWVALTLIAFIAVNLGVDLSRTGQVLGPGEADFVRTMLGLTFAYLVTTLVFRIEPKSVLLLPARVDDEPVLRKAADLTEEEQAVAGRIRALMTLDKLYQEPSFSRADLARELNVSETMVSRVINGAFAKSFRQLLNGHRVHEAKGLLSGCDRQVTQIAFDVGFNSLASFNRVFKEATGQSPTEFRAAAATAVDRQVADGVAVGS